MSVALNVYRKQDSFVEIRQSNPDREAVNKRIRALYDGLESRRLPDRQKKIVRAACRDILDGARMNGEPRFTLQEYVVQEMMRLQERDLPDYLFYRYRYEMFPQLKVHDDFPPCLQIEPASICNYRCVFCYQTDKALTNPKHGYMGLMPLDLFKRVVDQAEGRCEAITLASRGEPLINKQIDEMLAYASGKFLALKINTNAWYLDERKCHAILQADVNTVVFSADAASEPLYSQMRVNGKLDKVLANIRQFQTLRAREYPNSRTITRVSGVKFSTQQNLDEMEGLWGELVDEVAFVEYNPWENTYERPVNDISTPCSDLWRRTFVWFDGLVNPCDVDYRSTLAVGNVLRNELSDIWTGEKYAALREAHLNQRRNCVSPCNRCSLV
jgi:MoaA/NifB/PqqE/SkfB family radical SAM enzyme